MIIGNAHGNINREIRSTAGIAQIEHSNVVDISTSLSLEETRVLSKGLNFCPTKSTIDEFELHTVLTEFSRRMRIRHFFADNDGAETGTTTLGAQSTWTTEPEQAIELDLYLKAITTEIITEYKSSKKPRKITYSESRVISNLKTREDIIIKEADKGGSIVIWPMQKYKHDAYRQPNNPEHYRQLDNDSREQYTLTITNTRRFLPGSTPPLDRSWPNVGKWRQQYWPHVGKSRSRYFHPHRPDVG